MVFVKYVNPNDGQWLEMGNTWQEALENLKDTTANEYLNIQECEFYEAEHIIIKTEIYSK